MRKRIFSIVVDIFVAALILLGVWGVNYLIPQKGVHAVSIEDTLAKQSINQDVSLENTKVQLDSLKKTKIIMDTQDWHKKFADKFTDTVVATDASYISPNVSVKLSYQQYDTGKLDRSNFGKHEKYGTKISYVLADIYVGDIICLQTAFAKDIYGVGYSEKLTDMSAKMKSVLAVNGDSYSNNRHEDNGTIIRNGVIYRNKQTTEETCVLNWDGTMDIYQPGQINQQQLIDRGAYQSWIFGPSLLDENGKAKDTFLTYICFSPMRKMQKQDTMKYGRN